MKHSKSPNNICNITLFVILVGLLSQSCTVVLADWESEANARIEQIRKRDAIITVIDHSSNPVLGITVQIQQTGHLFGFGTCVNYSNLTGNSNYRNFVRDHFEWTVMENESKWYYNESTRDSEDYADADYIYYWCSSNGIKMRGHCLFWEQDEFVQQWVKDLPYAPYPTPSELLTEVDERINSAVNHFKNQFLHWDVDNEMLSSSFYDRLGEAGRVHMFQLANQVDPNCMLFMNEFSGNSFGSYDGWTYASRASSLISMGAPIHGIGIQGHINSPFDPQRYWDDVLEPLATLGLPIWVTEFDVSQANETLRANDMENFYRLAFSHPSVGGILMWGFWEGSHWRDNWWIVNYDWTLNEAGLRYEALMDEWTTEDTNTTDINGQVGFRGFHGTYEITLSAPGQPDEVYTIELEPGQTAAQFVIETDLSSPEPDTTPPQPDPMTWAAVPTATGSSTITMTATTATDDSPPVEYYFECINDSNASSGWQTDTTYVATGLTPNTEYTFRVKARDSATPIRNETGWSSEESATTEPPGTDVEILGSWISGLSHTKETGGVNRLLLFIAHVEEAGSIELTSVTYGGQPMTKIIDEIVGTSYQAYVVAYMLDEAGIAAATGDTFVPSWSTSPDNVGYTSVFLANVDQSNPIGETASNSTASSSPNPITTSPLSTDDGDMVILAATCGNPYEYTVNNGFTEAIEHSMASSEGVSGYKSATGVPETPSVTNNNPNRQIIIGFVVQSANIDTTPPASPTGLVATEGNNTVLLNWDDNTEPDLAGYNVYRSEDSGGPYTQLNTSLISDSNYIDDTVTNWTTYYYVVTAVDTALNESGFSNEVSATPDFQVCSDVQDANYALLADLNGDCYIDYLDLAIMTNFWLNTDCSYLNDYCNWSDLPPEDGDVDLLDFSNFATQWALCNDPENPDCIRNW